MLGEHEARPLKVSFFDLNDPFDHTNWSGTPSQIIRSLRLAGVRVVASGPHFLFIKKSINWVLHRYYRYVRKLFYHIDRDRFWMRIFAALASRRLRSYKDTDAIVTAFPAFAAYLRCNMPIFVIHDATWGQVVESYPWFSRSNQPKRIVEDGFTLERIAYTRTDVYPVLTSQWAADRAVIDYGVDRERISILPLGPNLTSPPSRTSIEAAIQRRGKGPCRLLFIGKEWMRKGGPTAIEVTAALIAMGVPSELHVAGPAELGPETSAGAALPSFVHSHGFLRKNDPNQAAMLERLYMESDFFLLPARAEALGVVFAEAAAYGLPCLGTSVGGVPSILRNEVDGAVFSPYCPAEEMAAWIRRHYLDRTEYESLARKARHDYESRLSSVAYGTQLAQIIRNRIRPNVGQEASIPSRRLAETA